MPIRQCRSCRLPACTCTKEDWEWIVPIGEELEDARRELAQYKALHANQKEYIQTLQQQNHELLRKLNHETSRTITPALSDEPSASN